MPPKHQKIPVILKMAELVDRRRREARTSIFILPKRRKRFHRGVRLALPHRARISLKHRLWKLPAL